MIATAAAVHCFIMSSDEQRFYYLRLMAKPGERDQPLKAKFVQWGSTREFNTSIEDDPDLEVLCDPLLCSIPFFCFISSTAAAPVSTLVEE